MVGGKVKEIVKQENRIWLDVQCLTYPKILLLFTSNETTIRTKFKSAIRFGGKAEICSGRRRTGAFQT